MYVFRNRDFAPYGCFGESLLRCEGIRNNKGSESPLIIISIYVLFIRVESDNASYKSQCYGQSLLVNRKKKKEEEKKEKKKEDVLVR